MPHTLPACSCRGAGDWRLHLLRSSPSSGTISHALVLDQPFCSDQGPAHLGELCDLAHVPSMPAGGGQQARSLCAATWAHRVHSGAPICFAALCAWHTCVCCEVWQLVRQ